MKNYKQIAPGFMEHIVAPGLAEAAIAARNRHWAESKCNSLDCYLCEVFASQIYAATRKKGGLPPKQKAASAASTRPDKHENVTTGEQANVNAETPVTPGEYTTMIKYEVRVVDDYNNDHTYWFSTSAERGAFAMGIMEWASGVRVTINDKKPIHYSTPPDKCAEELSALQIAKDELFDEAERIRIERDELRAALREARDNILTHGDCSYCAAWLGRHPAK